MRAESDGNVREVSPKGAMGLMQIMPETWTELRGRYGFGADPFDAHDNILAGAAYLRELHDRYGAAGFLAAYNAGPARYEDHVATGRPLPDETRAYMALLGPTIAGDQVDSAAIVTVAARFVDRCAAVCRARGPQAGPPTEKHPARASRAIWPIAAVQDLTALAPQSAGLFVRIAKRGAR